jgi:DNA modification methylase
MKKSASPKDQAAVSDVPNVPLTRACEDDLVIHQDKRNYRQHDKKNLDLIGKSLTEFGAGRSIVTDNSGQIIGGNGTFQEAEKLGIKPRIVHTSDDELVVVVRDDIAPDDPRRAKLAVMDNSTSDSSTFDFELLKEDFDFSDLADMGIELPELALDEDLPKDGETDPDAVPEAEEVPISETGKVYQLGDHRLMCGDSTSAEDVARLMQGEKADMVFTDPPYGMKKEAEGVANDNLNFDDLLEFNKKWIPLTFENLKDVGSWYCWGIDEPLMDIYSHILKPMAKRQKVTFRNLITWDKGNGQGQNSYDLRMYPIADEKCLFVMCGVQGFNTNADNYFEGWEPIRDYLLNSRLAMGWDVPTMKRIAGHSDLSGDHWTSKSQFNMPTKEVYNKLKAEAERQRKEKGIANDAFKREYDEIKREYYSTRAYFDNTHDNMNNVWHFDRTSARERENTGGHATPKPIELCARAIKSSSREGETVLDVFGGSGSTLIACEQTNRKCRMMELDEHYCDVIRRRWAEFKYGEGCDWQKLTPEAE